MYTISVDNRAIITNLSIGIAFVVFIAILFFHIVDSLVAIIPWIKSLRTIFSKQNHRDYQEDVTNSREEPHSFGSSMELRESLLI